MELKELLLITFLTFIAVSFSVSDSLEKDSLCPNSCDNQGNWLNGFECNDPPYCCLDDNELTCCYNESYKLNGRWGENHNCNNWLWWEHYWKFILGTGVALGGITLICSVILCIYQVNYERRRRLWYRNAQMAAGLGTNEERSSTQVMDNPVFTVEPISPPPYTADKPPDYIP